MLSATEVENEIRRCAKCYEGKEEKSERYRRTERIHTKRKKENKIGSQVKMAKTEGKVEQKTCKIYTEESKSALIQVKGGR